MVGSKAQQEFNETTNADTAPGQDPAPTEQRCLQRERTSQSGSGLNTLTSTHDDDDPSIRVSLNGKENAEWHRATLSEIDSLEKMDCWDIVDRSDDQNIRHTKFVLKRNKDENGNVKQYKARLIIRDDEESDYHEDKASPVESFTIAKLMICIGLQKCWTARHLDS